MRWNTFLALSKIYHRGIQDGSDYVLTQEGTTWAFEQKDTGAPFKFSGAHVKRPLSYYTSKPLDGEFIVAISASTPDPGGG